MAESDTERDVAQAAQRLEAGDLAGAETICNRVLSRDPAQPDGLHLLALIQMQRGNLPEAAELLRRAIGDSEWPLAQYNLGRVLAGQGDYRAAAEAFAEAARLEPTFVDAHLALGGAFNVMRDYPNAAAAFRRVIEMHPEFVPAHNNLGVALAALGKTDEAEAEYRRAIALNPTYAPAYQNLSNLALTQLRAGEALQLAERSVELSPDNSDAWLTLGNALRGMDRPVEAAAPYQRAVALRPDYVEARLCVSQALTQLRRHDEAIEEARRATEMAPSRADIHRALGLALEMAGRPDQAKDAYAEALRLDPSLAQVKYDLAVVSGQTPPAPPAEVVASLFDDYALRFEHHLVDELHYRAPQQIRESLDALGAVGPFDVMDLGCGTGLVGKTLRDRARSLVGVDLSSKMVELARRTGAYDRIDQKDAVAALRDAGSAAFDLIVAADVLIYVGEITELFAAAARSLRPGGLFAVSIEISTHSPVVLQPTRRYAHHPRYIRDTAQAARLVEATSRDIFLRLHEGHPLPGRILIYRKPETPR